MEQPVSAARSTRPGIAEGVAWILGAFVLNTVLANLTMAVVLGAGMFAVISLGLDERLGVPVYLAVATAGVGAHWAIMHVGIKTASTHVRVPWTIWPAMAAYPVLWAAAVLLTEPRGSLGITPSVFTGLAMLGAWLTLGEHRWTEA